MAKQIRHSDAIPEQSKQDRRVGKKTREKYNNKLYDIRVEKNISQRKLAELSGLTRNTIIRIENGDVEPSIDSCRKICSALGVPIMEVFNL